MWRAMSSTEIMQTTKDLLSSSSDKETEKPRRGDSVVGKQGNIKQEIEMIGNVLLRH